MTAPAVLTLSKKMSLSARVKAVTSAIKAVGETIAAVDVSPDGSFRVLTGERVSAADLAGGEPNEWDTVLPRA